MLSTYMSEYWTIQAELSIVLAFSYESMWSGHTLSTYALCHASLVISLPSPSFHLPQFEGNLTVDVPPFILGYSQKRQQDNVLAFDLEEAESVSPTPKTSLHVFVSVDPLLPQLPPVKHKVRMDRHTHKQ